MNNIITKIKQESTAIGFFGLATILILWQMLLPGYILTLDMVFTPVFRIFVEPGSFTNHLPLQFLIFVLTLIIPTWLVQKFILIGLFFAMGFLAYKYLPIPKDYGAPYWAGIFYMANPFVYERLLAGQWMILSAYALLPVLIHLLIRFYNNPIFKNGLALAVCYLLIGVFSLHLLVIGLFIGFAYGLFKIKKSNFKKIISQTIIYLLIVGVLSGYWLVPYLFQPSQNNLSFFDQSDVTAFATATDPVLGTIGNVLSLHGFWGETQPWSLYFIWPKDNFAGWVFTATLLFGLIIFGGIKAIRQDKIQSLFFIILGLVGLIFSVGVGESIFKPLNQFMFDYVWFWSGFRDSQKWSVVLILVYTVFASFGVNEIFKKLFTKFGSKEAMGFKILATIIFFVPILYTYTIWGGFSRQLKPVWYPDSWTEVKDILDQDQSDYNVLFMPFHQYLSLNFNQNIITQNPAKDFFGQKIIQGEKAEIGEVTNQPNATSAQVLWVLENNSGDQEEVLNALNKLNIKYIIQLSGYESALDSLEFGFVESKNLDKILEAEGLTFYSLLL